MDAATPPAASAPVHKRSHGLVCVFVLMLTRIPINNAPKTACAHFAAFKCRSQLGLKYG
jgi:hypothetical protein